MKPSPLILVTLLPVLLPFQIAAAPLLHPHSLQFTGAIANSEDLSAAALMHDKLVIAADEANSSGDNLIQWLRPGDSSRYNLENKQSIWHGNKHEGLEMDIEGMAADGDTLYVIGSHSLVRKRLKNKLSHSKNRKRMAKVRQEQSRNLLLRLSIAPDGGIRDSKQISLAPILAKNPVLSHFTAIPGKENGIDIEALAFRNGELYAGFRGPVLRGNMVPVLRFSFNRPQKNKLLYINLEGRGVRDMVTVSDGFLLLAGPVGEAPLSYQLWHWNGEDGLPDHGARHPATLVGELKAPIGGKAEGLALLSESESSRDVLVLYDGIKGGSPQRYTIFRQ